MDLLKKAHDVFEYPLIIFFIVGIVTDAFKITIAGFTPLIWFLISFWFLLIIICMETTMLRMLLDKKE